MGFWDELRHLPRSVGRGVKNIGKGVEGMFRGGQNPAQNARPYLDQVPQIGNDAYNPFIKQGEEAYNQLSPEYLKYLLNTEEVMNERMQGYEPSAYYKYQEPVLQRAATGAAAAGGYRGGEQDMRQQMELVKGLMGGDIGNYLDRIQGIQGLGQQGLESAVGRGFQGAGANADFQGTALGNRANLEYAGKAQQGMNKSQLYGDIAKAVAQAFGAGGFGGAKEETPQQGMNRGAQELVNIQTRPFAAPERQFGQGGYKKFNIGDFLGNGRGY